MDENATDGGPAAMVRRLRRATRPDGSPHLMRGVVIFGVSGGVADWARFYLEPVTEDGKDASAAVHGQVGSGGSQ